MLPPFLSFGFKVPYLWIPGLLILLFSWSLKINSLMVLHPNMPLKLKLVLESCILFHWCLCRSVACEQPHLNAVPVKWGQFLLFSTVLRQQFENCGRYSHWNQEGSVEKGVIIVHPHLKAGLGSFLKSWRGRLKRTWTGFWQCEAMEGFRCCY